MTAAKAPFESSPTDKDWVRGLFLETPIVGRLAPVFKEMLWFFSGCPDMERHEKPLPDYCYNILDTYQRTYFKHFPLPTDIVQVTNPAALPEATTIEQAKKVVRFDWHNLGKLSAIGVRGIRFTQLEAGEVAGSEGLGDETPESAKELFTIILGAKWVAQNEARILATLADKLFAELMNEFLASWIDGFKRTLPQLDALAYQWSAQAMTEFHEGYAEGMTAFLLEDGQFREESERANTYAVLLLVWPEIKKMQESQPRKTLTDLYEWLKPFMHRQMMPDLDLDQFRDVCAPPPSGIGLVMRPLNTCRSSA